MSLAFNAPEPDIFGGPRDRSYPAPVEFLHVSIMHSGPGVDDLVKFYQVALNLRYVFKFTYPLFEFIALSYDDENHRVGIVNVFTEAQPGAVPTDRPLMKPEGGVDPRDMPNRLCRLEHTSWLYRDFEALLLNAKRIHQELGIWPRSTRHAGKDLTIDYNDPDGNRLEMLSCFRGRAQVLFDTYQRGQMTEGERRQFSETYMSLSMEKLVGLYDSGVPLATLQDREYCRRLIAEGKL